MKTRFVTSLQNLRTCRPEGLRRKEPDPEPDQLSKYGSGYQNVTDDPVPARIFLFVDGYFSVRKCSS
jgi:hypothetical protein